MRGAKASSPHKNNSRSSKLRIVWEYVSTLAVMAAVVFSARSSLADWYEVPSGSMLPTIQLGDRIFVSKLAYDLRIPFTSISLMKLGTPRRGDIVVFVYPKDNRTDYVKRLVGLPGDTVELRRNILCINDRPMARRKASIDELPPGADYATDFQLWVESIDHVDHFVYESKYYKRKTDDFSPVTIPPEMYFMMGDNRDNSHDSRDWGFVPKKNLRGRALRVVLSFDPSPKYHFWNLKRIRFSRSLEPLDPPREP